MKHLPPPSIKLSDRKHDSIPTKAAFGAIRELISSSHITSMPLRDFVVIYGLGGVVGLDSIIMPATNRRNSSLSPLETQVLCTIVKGLGAKTLFEIGTFKGRTAVAVASVLGTEGRVYTLNLPQHHCNFEVGQYIREYKSLDSKISLLTGDSMHFDFSPWYNSIDLMLIDGSHGYDAVRYDTKVALHCVRAGGFIAWHDFSLKHLGCSAAIFEAYDKDHLSLVTIDSTTVAVAQVGT